MQEKRIKEPSTIKKNVRDVLQQKKNNCSESDDLLWLLNSALSHAQINNNLDLQRFGDFEKDEISFIENLLVNGVETSISDENLLVSDVYRVRANHFHDVGDYEMSVVEALRAMNYAKFNKKNPCENIFQLLFYISASLRHLNQWTKATNVIQFSIKLLRLSSLKNTTKSVETVRLVKLIKEIQILSKERGDNGAKPINLKFYLEPKKEILPKIFRSTSEILVNASILVAFSLNGKKIEDDILLQRKQFLQVIFENFSFTE